MKTKKIKKSIDISAPKEKVWDVLLNDKFSRQWYAEFSEGSHAETDWKVGSKVVYTDNSKGGLVGKVIANKPNEELTVEFTGVVYNAVENYDSEDAKAMKGALETYKLSGKSGNTNLAIESDMGEEWFEPMSQAWDKALGKIKSLSEKK